MDYTEADVGDLGRKLEGLQLSAGEAAALQALITFASPYQGTDAPIDVRRPLTPALRVALFEPDTI